MAAGCSLWLRCPMWWLAEPLDLHRVSERVSTVYVERSHVDRAENAVVFINKERTVRVPAGFIGALLLGPGTRITSGAVRLLADSGTAVSWVGEHGVRMYAHGLGPSRGAGLAQRQAYLVSRTKERLEVARAMYSMRFPGEDVSKATMQQLRGREGARVRKLYRDHSSRTGVAWKRREYAPGDAHAAGDDINRALSAAHACLYGACHAAIVGVGAIPALGFVHTGSALSFVLDVADLYKADYSIPVAFDCVSAGLLDESDVRYAMRERFRDGRFMKTVVNDLMELLGVPGSDATQDEGMLWDDIDGAVESGRNYADPAVQTLIKDGHLVVSGPEVPEVGVPW